MRCNERVYPCNAPRPWRGRYRTAAAAVIAACAMLTAAATTARADAPMRFGVDAQAATKAVAQGLPLSYGSIWAGAWNQKEKYGWGGIKDQLLAAKAAGVTPVIQWWYWGDDISPACVENGCTDRYEGVRKDKATWYRMSNELADLIVTTLGSNSGAIVIVETEFNKRGIETYEKFDGYLADHALIFHNRQLQVVISFGNWDQSRWWNFDRAVAAADMLGAMVLESSIHEAADYQSGADLLINQAKQLQGMFGKPCLVTDFAFSSYPSSSYESLQSKVITDIFARMPELKAAGVRGMIWRMLADDPKFDTSNYHGMAERFWGLLRADGSRKPGFTAFLNGMLADAASAAGGSGAAGGGAADGGATGGGAADSGAAGGGAADSGAAGGGAADSGAAGGDTTITRQPGINAVFRPSNGTWYVRSAAQASSGAAADAYQWGLQGDVPVSADFDGDKALDLTVFRPSNGTWYIRYSSLGYDAGGAGVVQWGLPGDVPVAGDFDGDGRTDLTVFRPATGQWFIRFSRQNYDLAGYTVYQWGLPGDVPVAGDFDGDGRTDLTVFRPATGQWFTRFSTQNYEIGGFAVNQWGLPGDQPLAGDFDGDGRTEIAVFRPSNGTWYVRYSKLGYSTATADAFQWGLPGDVPLTSDLDGDGRIEIAVFRPSTGQSFIRSSTQGYSVSGYGVFQWGQAGDALVK